MCSACSLTLPNLPWITVIQITFWLRGVAKCLCNNILVTFVKVSSMDHQLDILVIHVHTHCVFHWHLLRHNALEVD